MKITRENIGEHLVRYQLRMVNKDLKDMFNDDKWRFNITMTRKQFAKFKKYSLYMMQKTFKCNRTKAKNTFEWLIMRFGLRIKG